VLLGLVMLFVVLLDEFVCIGHKTVFTWGCVISPVC